MSHRNQDVRKRASNVYYYAVGKAKRQERAAEKRRLKEEERAEEEKRAAEQGRYREERAEKTRRDEQGRDRDELSGHVDLEVSTDLLEPGPRPRGDIPKALLEALVLKDDLVAWKSAWGGVSAWRGMYARYAAGEEEIVDEYGVFAGPWGW